jgi:hypothetical protein
VTPVPPGWKCPRRVGFLFPHACQRTTPEGCPDCQNGQIEDPYVGQNRYFYSSYDYYGDDYFVGIGPVFDPVPIGSSAGALDFTEADGADLVQSGGEYESDMTES